MDTKYRSLALISERFGKTYVYSEPSRGLLLYVLDVTNIDKECFLAAFDEASPDLVVDDRDFPRFDFGTFCRSKMFEMLDTRNILYLRSKSLINYDLNKEREGRRQSRRCGF